MYPNATISISGWSNTGIETDTVTFSLYNENTCTSAPIYTTSAAVTGTSISTSNTSFALTTDGAYYWKIDSTGNDANNPFSIGCGVITTIVDL